MPPGTWASIIESGFSGTLEEVPAQDIYDPQYSKCFDGDHDTSESVTVNAGEDASCVSEPECEGHACETLIAEDHCQHQATAQGADPTSLPESPFESSGDELSEGTLRRAKAILAQKIAARDRAKQREKEWNAALTAERCYRQSRFQTSNGFRHQESSRSSRNELSSSSGNKIWASSHLIKVVSNLP